MIQFRIRLTLPLLLVLLVALILWLTRKPTAGSVQPAHQSPKHPPRPSRRRKPPTTEPIILTQDGAPDLTYADALAAGVTGEALREIGDREAFESAKTAYAEALADPTYRDQIAKLRSWRNPHHADD